MQVMVRTTSLLLAIAVLGVDGVARFEEPRRPTATSTARAPHQRNSMTPSLSHVFEENRGQVDAPRSFLVRARGYVATISATSLAFACSSSRGKTAAASLTFVGASADAAVEGVGQLAAHSNYFVGSSPSGWRTRIPMWTGVVVHSVYPGIDVKYTTDDAGRLEYSLVLAPGADPAQIAIRMDNAVRSTVNAAGDLLTTTSTGILRQTAPHAFQRTESGCSNVLARFVPRPNGTYGVMLGAHDSQRPVVIDPSVVFTTLFGGSGDEGARPSVAVGADGAIYVAGVTPSLDFPAVSGEGGKFGTTGGGAFIAKFAPDGRSLVWTSFLGYVSEVADVTVDASNAVYVVGTCGGSGFPLMNPIDSTSVMRFSDAFLTKIAANGAALIYSTRLGWGDYYSTTINTGARGLALDSAGAAYVTGWTYASQDGIHGSSGWVRKVNPGGTAYDYTAMFAARTTFANDIAVDASGNAWVTGFTEGGMYGTSQFPTTFGAFSSTSAGDREAFLVKLAPGGSVAYATLFGGSFVDKADAIAIGPGGTVYVAGVTGSADWASKVSSTGVYTVLDGSFDAFLVKFDGAGVPMWSTLLGGSATEGDANENRLTDVVVDGTGAAYVVGRTYSTDFPTVGSPPIQAASTGVPDGFVTKVASTGTQVVFSTYLGGSGSDWASRATLAASGDLLVAGQTNSADFPFLNATTSFDTSIAGYDNFLVRISPAFSGGGGAGDFTPVNLAFAYDNLTDATGTLSWTLSPTPDSPAPWYQYLYLEVEASADGVKFMPWAATQIGKVDITGGQKWVGSGSVYCRIGRSATQHFRARTVLRQGASHDQVVSTSPWSQVLQVDLGTAQGRAKISPKRVRLSAKGWAKWVGIRNRGTDRMYVRIRPGEGVHSDIFFTGAPGFAIDNSSNDDIGALGMAPDFLEGSIPPGGYASFQVQGWDPQEGSALLPPGKYVGDLTIETSDPKHPSTTVRCIGRYRKGK